jgi:hypothetical protein
MTSRRVSSFSSRKREEQQEQKEEKATKIAKTKGRKLASKLRCYQAALSQMATNFEDATSRTALHSKSTSSIKFSANVICPVCFHLSTTTSVDAAARRDRYSHLFECNNCSISFAPVISAHIDNEDGPSEPFIWLCRMQTRDQFVEWMETVDEADRDDTDDIIIKRLADERPDIYWNALRYTLEDSELAPEEVGPMGGKLSEWMIKFLC